MLTGTYFHTIDAAGRMNFPSKLRDGLGEQFYVTSWYDDCLVAFSEQEFAKVQEKILEQSSAKTRDLLRWLGSNAVAVEPDKQGRILIPANIRDKAGIDGEVAVIGALNKAEIWSKQKWLNKSESLDSDFFDQKMMELDL